MTRTRTHQNLETVRDLTEIHNRVERALAEVIVEAQRSKDGDRDVAIVALMTHIANMWKGIATLSTSTIDVQALKTLANPTASLIRCIYDAFFQLRYILAKPKLAEERAKDYLAFATLEQREFIRTLEGDNSLQMLTPSEQRRWDAYVGRVEKQYAAHDAKRFSDRERVYNWHGLSLLKLAKASKLEADYIRYVKFSNSSVHANAFTVLKGPLLPGHKYVALIGSDVACRGARAVSSAMKLKVTGDTKQCLAEVTAILGDCGLTGE